MPCAGRRLGDEIRKSHLGQVWGAWTAWLRILSIYLERLKAKEEGDRE